ncbi:MAG TPA: DUF2071 domain-containing protein [Clostridia bacterium]|nr:DUF2071 domain-containing protein [Clostridia bacterium]
MTQTWNDLLFAHFAIEPRKLRALVPDVLTLDLYQGNAWLSVTPFWISNLRPTGLPPAPLVSRFPELNVRTYVTYEGKPGIFFFSLDAGNLSAVWGARIFYRLPYWHADMKIWGALANGYTRNAKAASAPDEIHYRSKRLHGPRAVKGMPELRGVYRPATPVRTATPGSLPEFLSERYCLYAFSHKRLYRGEIHHLPWPLQTAEVELKTNTMAEPIGITLPEQPDLTHFSRSLKVLVWPPQRLL